MMKLDLDAACLDGIVERTLRTCETQIGLASTNVHCSEIDLQEKVFCTAEVAAAGGKVAAAIFSGCRNEALEVSGGVSLFTQ